MTINTGFAKGNLMIKNKNIMQCLVDYITNKTYLNLYKYQTLLLEFLNLFIMVLKLPNM